MLSKLFVIIQHILPQHLLSRWVGCIAESRLGLVKNALIKLFIKAYNVDMTEAIHRDPSLYGSFNEFFARELIPGARPLCSATAAIAAPADGAISQVGEIESGFIIQAKGREFDVTTLMGGDDYLSDPFRGGKFMTIYLAPKDYHRVHMPCDGQLQTMIHVPGQLFSVNDATTQQVANLFARNERVVSIFDTDAGPMAVVMVGAMVVASIETTWAGIITPPRRQVRTTHYPDTREVKLSKGSQLGSFRLGSTVIVLFGPDMVDWEANLATGANIKMGSQIGAFSNG